MGEFILGECLSNFSFRLYLDESNAALYELDSRLKRNVGG